MFYRSEKDATNHRFCSKIRELLSAGGGESRPKIAAKKLHILAVFELWIELEAQNGNSFVIERSRH